MNIKQAVNSIISDPNFQLIKIELQRKSVFHILNIKNRELSHAAFLAWLLSPSSQHDMGVKPLRSFLMESSSIIEHAEVELNKETFIDAIAIEGLDFDMVNVETEVSTSDGKGKIDILASINLNGARVPLLIIEYKVKAKETGKQTEVYAEWAGKQPKYNAIYSPLHIYLTPNRNNDESPSKPFAIMDYDSFSDWLEHIQNFDKSPQAEFLLSEFLSCLQRERYATDPLVEELLDSLKKKNRKAIEILKSSKPNTRPDDATHIFNNNREIWELLEIQVSSKSSLGNSPFIISLKEYLEKIVSDKWSFGGGTGSISIKNNDFTEEVKAVLGNSEHNIQCQFFMSRPEKSAARLVFEIVDRSKNKDKNIRETLANSLRDNLRPYLPPEILGRKDSSTVLSYKIILSGFNNISDDTEELFKSNLQAIQSELKYIEIIENELEQWMKNGGIDKALK